MVLAVIGVALVAALVTFLILLVVRPPKKKVVTQAPTNTTLPTTTVPPPTLPTGAMLTAARLKALTDELVPFVEQARMLKFKTPPTPKLDDAAAFTAAFNARLARTNPMLEKLDVPFKALGLNPNSLDLVAAQKAFYGDGAVAFYDPVTNVLHVKEVPDSPYVSASLVAALTEQLDDQHFTVDAMDTPKNLGDDIIGMRSMVVGDGQRIADLWVNEQSPDDQNAIREEAQARFGAARTPDKVPSALSAWLALPARHGGEFTTQLVTASTSMPLNHAFAAPPDGSASLLVANRFQDGIAQLTVATPKADGPDTAHGTLGYLLLSHVFANVVESSKVTAAMDSYRGDALVAWKSESRSCTRIDVSTGTASNTQLRQVMKAWADKASGTLETVPGPKGTNQTLLRLTVCTPGNSDSPTTSAPTTTAPSTDTPPSTVPGHGTPEI